MINGESIIKALSSSKDGIVTTSYADDAVVDKKAYSIRQTFTIANNNLQQIVFDPSLYGEDVFLEPFRVAVTVGPVRMRLIPGVTIDSGDTELPVFNRYGLVDNPAHKMGCFDTFTNLSLGTEDPLEYVIGSKSTNQASGGGSIAGTDIFLFEKDKKYLLEFDNSEGAGETITVSLQFDWFEL